MFFGPSGFGTSPSFPPASLGGSLFGGLQCVTGFVNLFRFFAAPQPGEVIGQLRTLSGVSIPLVQTQTIFGGTTLALVDRQFATVCGVFVVMSGQVVLDVRLVNPGSATPSGGFFPSGLTQEQLLLLLLLGSQFGGSTGAGTSGTSTRF